MYIKIQNVSIKYHNQLLILTKPVLDRAKVSPLIEDHIEDEHDTNHGVEGDQSSEGRELTRSS